MVRVISVHNFPKQDISSVEELSDAVEVPPDLLLLIRSDQGILAKDLSAAEEDVGYIIPTVDQAFKIIYSVRGNYIGTLERKLTRNGLQVCHVRIYLNWSNLKNFKDFPPMRARIAGRVTPLSQNNEGLEMIEIPALNMPDNIACCPISGNLLVSSKNHLIIYNLKVLAHDISKMYFVDFERVNVNLMLSFVPVNMKLAENVIAIQSDEFLHVFRIVAVDAEEPDKKADCSPRSWEDRFRETTFDSDSRSTKKEINYEKLLKEFEGVERQRNMSSTFEPTRIGVVRSSGVRFSEISKLDDAAFPVRHEFPTVAAVKKLLESKSPDVRKCNPFFASQHLTVTLTTENAFPPEKSKTSWVVENLLQYQLPPLVLGSTSNQEIQEKFTCLILKAYYSGEAKEIRSPRKRGLLESDRYDRLKTLACFFGTQQEGYLHAFDLENDLGRQEDLYVSYVVYPFTAPVIQVKLEDSLLHALTETGLETYTVRGARHLMKNDHLSVAPSCLEPVCLIGLRPFVNVLGMCLTSRYLLLFANNEESSNTAWTLYKLSLPRPTALWHDFLAVAEENKWEAPATYIQLVGEGHLILKTYLDTVKWRCQAKESENQVYLPEPLIDEKERSDCEKVFKESCALLADFHALNGDFLKSSNYYRMCDQKACEIIARMEAVADGIPEKFRCAYNSKTMWRALIFHLKRSLSFHDDSYSRFQGNKEEFYTPEIGSIVNILLDYLERENNGAISDLILESAVLREFSTDRILKMMKNVLTKSSPPREKDALSLALLCIQRDQSEQAKTVLLTMKPSHLRELVSGHRGLLFERRSAGTGISFTELAMVLVDTHPLVLGEILSVLVAEEKVISLSKLLNVFLEILPSGTVRAENSSSVLRVVLEDYFDRYFDVFPDKKLDSKLSESLKVLIRIYLSFLHKKPKRIVEYGADKEDGSDPVRGVANRPEYLNVLPPFASDFEEEGTESAIETFHLKEILVKIQGLLSRETIPPDCLAEVRNFISNQSNVYGHLSLRLLSATHAQEAIRLLLDFAPHALLSFAKDRIKDLDDWKYLIEQLQRRISAAEENYENKFHFKRILQEVLFHGAKYLPIEDLVEILPGDLEDGEKYLGVAQNNAQANHIKTLIVTTGKQLKSTLYDLNPERNVKFHGGKCHSEKLG